MTHERRRRSSIARTFSLLASLAACGVASAGTLAAIPASFSLGHGGEVDSGVISVLGSFTSTSTSTLPTIRLPKFDPSVGRLTGVSVAVNTSSSTFSVAPSGLLSLVSFAAATRSLGYTVTAGATVAGDGAVRIDSGPVLLTLPGLGTSEIGGAQLAKTTSFSAQSDLANFVGSGSVAVDISASDTLSVSTLVSLLNGAGFSGSGQCAGSVALTYTYSPYPSDGQLAITKTVSASTARSGDAVTYTLTFTNNGISPITGLSINDETPAYTTYQSSRTLAVPGGLTASGTTAPAPGATGALAWGFTGQLAAAASGVVQYTVIVQ